MGVVREGRYRGEAVGEVAFADWSNFSTRLFTGGLLVLGSAGAEFAVDSDEGCVVVGDRRPCRVAMREFRGACRCRVVVVMLLLPVSTTMSGRFE